MVGFLTTRRQPRALTGTYPRDVMQRLQDEMDDVLSRFFGDGGTRLEGASMMMPSLDVSETEDAIEIRMDAPGIKPEDINLEIQGNMLMISGNRQEETEEKGRTYHRVERTMGSFQRSVTLPAAVHEDQVNAEYHDGVLTVRLPKPEEAKPKRIEVKT